MAPARHARHARRSGLLSRLLPGRTRRREAEARQRALLRSVADELRHGRAAADAALAAQAAATEAALARARAAETALAELRTEVARLREELLWAWAEGRLPSASLVDDLPAARVIDLRGA
jgi:chromosome segregation ATPase